MLSARAVSPVSVRSQAGQVAQNFSDRLGVSGMAAAAVGLIALATTLKAAGASAAVNDVDADRDPAMRMWMHTVNKQYSDMAQQVSQLKEQYINLATGQSQILQHLHSPQTQTVHRSSLLSVPTTNKIDQYTAVPATPHAKRTDQDVLVCETPAKGSQHDQE